MAFGLEFCMQCYDTYCSIIRHNEQLAPPFVAQSSRWHSDGVGISVISSDFVMIIAASGDVSTRRVITRPCNNTPVTERACDVNSLIMK